MADDSDGCDSNAALANSDSEGEDFDDVTQRLQQIKQTLEQQCCAKNCSLKVLKEWEVLAPICAGVLSGDINSRKTAVMGSISSNVPAYDPNKQRMRVTWNLPNVKSVCVGTFATFVDLSRKQLKGLLGRVRDGNWFSGYKHGLTDEASNRSLLPQTRRLVVDWIVDLAETNAVLDPSRRHRKYEGKNGQTVQYLPSMFTFEKMTEQFNLWFLSTHPDAYKDELQRRSVRDFAAPPGVPKRRRVVLDDDIGKWPAAVSACTLRRVFLKEDCLLHIKFRKPRSDVCDDCSAFYSQKVTVRADGPEMRTRVQVRESVLDEWHAHIVAARRARGVWLREVAESKDTCPVKRNADGTFSAIEGRCWKDWLLCLSFDFAQQLEVPNLVDVVGSFYFMSLLHFKLFGIMNDGLGVQTNFIFREGDTKKGSNVVTTLLDLYLDKCLDGMIGGLNNGSVQDIEHLRLHADNCIGQNKNNTMLALLLWMASSKSYNFKTITLKFMVKGHTKFSPDGAFGHVKKLYRHREVFTMEQAISVINDSAVSNVAHEVKSGDIKNWMGALDVYFKKLPGITQFHEFKFTRATPGVVEIRHGDHDTWKRRNLWDFERCTAEELFPTDGEPTGTTAGVPHSELKAKFDSLRVGLESERGDGVPMLKRFDLFEKLRDNVPNEYKDVVCPKPDGYETMSRTQLMQQYKRTKLKKAKQRQPSAVLSGIMSIPDVVTMQE